MSRIALPRLRLDQMLWDCRGVIRCKYASSSIAFFMPSMHPQQSAFMTISLQVTLLFPVFFLNTLTQSSLSDAYLASSQSASFSVVKKLLVVLHVG